MSEYWFLTPVLRPPVLSVGQIALGYQCKFKDNTSQYWKGLFEIILENSPMIDNCLYANLIPDFVIVASFYPYRSKFPRVGNQQGGGNFPSPCFV